jgi:hypothetical protein
MHKQAKPKGLTRHLFDNRLIPIGLSLTLGCTTLLTYADTVYRCGDAYSATSQCGNAAATEVKPTSVLHTSAPSKSNAAAHDLREAQTLEKQRRQAERQAAQTAPVHITMPSAPVVAPAEPTPHKSKHSRKAPSPYFTVKDPNAATQKKSTTKAVPAASAPGQ